jgi:FlaG/FlaF family flagellin (archaellin)
MTILRSDTAASELIGVMALIAVFVTAAAIAGVTLLSYPREMQRPRCSCTSRPSPRGERLRLP